MWCALWVILPPKREEGALSCFSLREKRAPLRGTLRGCCPSALPGWQLGKGKGGMASYHCTVKVGGKGRAGSHSDYIAREGKYSGSERYEDLEATGSGNMPAWAEHNPANFWKAADEHERANGATYREIEVALPRELTPEQRRELVEDFIKQELGDRHANQWAIHTPKAALDGGEQPHAHIMYSERKRDGIERDPDQYFKRYNGKAPERGGCQKDSAGTRERLEQTRELWAKVQNSHLERHGHQARVDHRSLAARGIEREPEKHIGGKGVRQLGQADISALLERRTAEGELDRAKQAVSGLLDLSGNLSAAVADRDRDRQQWLANAPLAELKAEARRQELPSLSELVGRDPKIAEARDMQRQAEAVRGKASQDVWQTQDAIREWRETHPVKAKMHDSGIFPSEELGKLEAKLAQAKSDIEAAGQQAEKGRKAEASELKPAQDRIKQQYGGQLQNNKELRETIAKRELTERKEKFLSKDGNQKLVEEGKDKKRREEGLER
jgi:hypothetical protein